MAPPTDFLDALHWMSMTSAGLTEVCERYDIQIQEPANKGQKTQKILSYLKENPEALAALQEEAKKVEEEEKKKDDRPKVTMAIFFGTIPVSRTTSEILTVLGYTGAMRPRESKKGSSDKKKELARALGPAKKLAETLVESINSFVTILPSAGTMFQRLEMLMHGAYGGVNQTEAIVVRKEVKALFDIFLIKVGVEDNGAGDAGGGNSQSSDFNLSRESAASISADRPGRLGDEVAYISLGINALLKRWAATFPDAGKPITFPGSFDKEEQRDMREFVNAEMDTYFGDGFDYSQPISSSKEADLVEKILNGGKMPHCNDPAVVQSVVLYQLGTRDKFGPY